MASPPKAIPISPRALRMDTSELMRAGTGTGEDGHNSLGSPQHPARLSPTLSRSYDPTNPENLERQRTMDADFAMQLSRARSASIALAHHPSLGQLRNDSEHSITGALTGAESLNELAVEEEEEEENGYFPSNINDTNSAATPGLDEVPPPLRLPGIDPSVMMSQTHDPSLLVSNMGLRLRRSGSTLAANPVMPDSAPPFDSASPPPPRVPSHQGLGAVTGGGIYRSKFDFALLDTFATEERSRLGLSTGPEWNRHAPRRYTTEAALDTTGSTTVALEETTTTTQDAHQEPEPQPGIKHRRLSHNTPQPRRPGGKLALFESTTAGLAPFDLPPPTGSPHLMPSNIPVPAGPSSSSDGPIPPMPPLPAPVDDYDETKPYRFAFYSNGLRSTIHARSLSELPAEGQTFEELFLGKRLADKMKGGASANSNSNKLKGASPNPFGKQDLPELGKNGNRPSELPNWKDEEDANSWWVDILSPTDEEMRVLSKCFGIHPLTAEDIQMEETREKIELFRNYYLVCFRSFDQNQYSPTYLEPINYYIVVFREGILSFHFRASPHPQNVRRRIKQLKDYISVTSDWISYALIDDITDAFGPLIQSIEYEVDSIDELVLILKEAEQSDMLRRIGTCRKKVMGLLRLMGNKADVVKGLAKRCNENWSMAPKSDIGLYLSDIQDHLITMTQSLNHYEKLLSRSHSNYLAQISIEMTDANNQINDVLSRLTALGTILIPMNLITGLWGMNVHVPGQDIHEGYAWFIGIICFLVGIGGVGSWGTYRLMRRSRRR